MSQVSDSRSDDHLRGTEVFVGGVPRTITEEKIRELFSPCGEIVEVRLIKDLKGNLKGYCFVRFATKEAAGRAVKEKSGIVLEGKKIGVLLSTEQDTLYFGSLNKGWTAEEFKKLVLQVFPDVASVDLAMLKDVPPGQKHINRGFGFVKFSSHAAAARALRVGSQPDFRLGGTLHPAVQWAEEESEIDPTELAKIKIAFVRNLPVDAEEDYLKRLFEPFGKIDKIVISKKSATPVGFVHFSERSDLDRAIKEMNEKTIQGPSGGRIKLQVEVARPMDKNKKRAREDTQSNPTPVQGQLKLLKEDKSVTVYNIQQSSFLKEPAREQPYEAAVLALPLVVRERLLRILRLGIATRSDVDMQSVNDLKQLPESVAISILDQFMLSGSDIQNKGAYLARLISKHLVDQVGLNQNLASLSRVANAAPEDIYRFSNHPSLPADSLASRLRSTLPGSDIYASRYSMLSDYPVVNQAGVGRMEDRDPDYPLSSRATIRRVEDRSSDYLLPSRATIGSLEERSLSPLAATQHSSVLYGKVALRGEETQLPRAQPIPGQSVSSYGRVALIGDRTQISPAQPLPSSSSVYPRLGQNLSSDMMSEGEHQAAPRPQVRFDPYTGEPYKFDPFTGEPIRPEGVSRHF